MKKLIALLLGISIVVCGLVVGAVAAEEEITGGVWENVTWTYNTETKELRICGEGPMPGEWPIYFPWAGIDAETLVIEEGITSVSREAFDGMNLTSVTLPETIESIEMSAFRQTQITEIHIPAAVTSIALSAFRSCYELERYIVSPDNASYCSDEYGVLYTKDMTYLQDMPPAVSGDYVIPDSVTQIFRNAFEDCKYLTSLHFHAGVDIPFDNLESASGLKRITVDPNHPDYSSDEKGVLFNKDKTELLKIPNAYEGHYDIPESVVTFGERSQPTAACSKLTSIFIPATTTSIQYHWDYSLMPAKNLEQIIVHEDNPNYCDHQGVLYSKDMTMLYRIPRGFRGAYTIPETVTEIKYMGAIECRNLTEVTIPSSVETVGSYAFECCDSLEVIRFTGDAPTFVYECFFNVAATVYYPAGNATWTEAVMTNPDLGSTELTWVAVPAIALNYPTLSFEDQIQYNVYFTLSDVSNVTEMGLITFDSKLTDGTIANAVEIIPGYTTSGSSYIVHSNGIPAKKLGDALYFKVYAKLTDGSYIYTNVAGYNAVAYAKSILGNAGSSMDAKRLMVAMLNYGAEAQVNFNYKTDNLMNAFLTDAQRNLVNAYDESMVDDVVAASSAKAGHFVMQSGSYTSIYPTISFEGAFSVNYYFKTGLTPDAGLTFAYWDADTYNSADKLTTANATGLFKMTQDGDAWTAAVEGIAAKDIDKTIYVAAVYKSGGTVYVSKVIPYSIGKYCETIAAQGNAFGAATAVYGYYAKTYFANL